MAFEILNISPNTGSINVPLNLTLRITFNEPIDPFTVASGVSLYTLAKGTWSGPDLAILDNKHTDVLSGVNDYIFHPLKYVVEGASLTVTPVTKLLPGRKYFLCILPGNDVERFLSAATVGPAIYTRVDSSTGTVSAASAYSGATSQTLVAFKTTDGYDITIGTSYLGTIVPTSDGILETDLVKIKVTDTFDDGDSFSIDLFKASGTTSIYKTEFSTSSYAVIEPVSTAYGSGQPTLSVVDTIPGSDSTCNAFANPVTIKFDKDVDPTQVFDGIKITKTSYVNGITRAIKFQPKVAGNILKLYLVSVGEVVADPGGQDENSIL